MKRQVNLLSILAFLVYLQMAFAMIFVFAQGITYFQATTDPAYSCKKELLRKYPNLSGEFSVIIKNTYTVSQARQMIENLGMKVHSVSMENGGKMMIYRVSSNVPDSTSYGICKLMELNSVLEISMGSEQIL